MSNPGIKSSLIERLKAGTDNSRRVPFAGGEVLLRVLSDQEAQDATIATERYFIRLKLAIGQTTIDAYMAERAVQLLWRAMRDPDDPQTPAATSADALRALLTKEETEYLAAEYEALEKESSPNFTAMKEDEFRLLWEDVKKNAKALTSGLSTGTLRGLLLYLASRPAASLPASGST